MPFRVWATTGAANWTPSDDGIANGTTVRFHAAGSSGTGGSGDNIIQTGGGG